MIFKSIFENRHRLRVSDVNESLLPLSKLICVSVLSLLNDLNFASLDFRTILSSVLPKCFPCFAVLSSR